MATAISSPTTDSAVAITQRNTLRLLFATQVVSGVGFAIGSSVGALLAAEMAGVGLSGLAQSASVVGAALFAIPATAIVQRYGRRPSLAAGYGVASLGALIVVGAALLLSIPLLFAGFFLFGSGTAASYQARYAAVDLAPAALRGRHLSLIVWATTIGAVAGPNLAPVAGRSLAPYGIPTLAAPYVFSVALLAVAMLLIITLLRPDPFVVARSVESASMAREDVRRTGTMRDALKVVLSSPAARLAVVAMAVSHIVMVAVMSMTPVHIRAAGYDATHTLKIVGVVISVHIAGMFAFSPIMGWLTDRFGRRSVIALGIVLLLISCALAGVAGHDHTQLGIALMVLGLGWSAAIVAGSTLLTDALPAELRASGQGLSDLIMGLAGASAGALSGVVVSVWSYPMLALLAAVMTAPVMLLSGYDRMRPANTGR